jgi:aspartyl-tRNA(Asn)/glutamyl-tRNA(Gln) amidotransferase subunit B
MKTYISTIGLEVHAELKTKTKMFCSSKNDPDEKRPNVNICPVCMAHPGTLPVINKAAVQHIVRIGMALGGTIADYTEFDRKNYFYPDIPKGYQISQYKYPLVTGGTLNGVAITRVHLEEDTARSSHHDTYSLVDFNRAGVPLMELVTEPVVHSAEEAVAFAKELQLLLRSLGAGEANLEKGEMRVEANISVSTDPNVFGTKVEVKNLNSFKSVEQAIRYEIDRHIELIEAGEKVIQETRGWDEAKGSTFSQRLKENSHDYRYFPDPDLPKLFLSKLPEFNREVLKASLPELPWQKRERYLSLGLKKEDTEVFTSDIELGEFFDSVSKLLKGERNLMLRAANYLTSDIVGLLNKGVSKEIRVSYFSKPELLAELVRMIESGDLSSRGAKDILLISLERGDIRSPKILGEEHGLIQKSDTEALEKIAREIADANKKVVEDFKNGKEAALQFLVGQGMKVSRGSANPNILREVFKKILL